MKQKLTEMKGEIDNSIIIVGDSNISLSIMNKTRKKINKETEDLNNTTNQQTSIEIPTQEQQNILSSQDIWNIFQDTPNIRLQSKPHQINKNSNHTQ